MNGITNSASNIEYAQINGKSTPVIRKKIEKYEGPLTVDDLKPSKATEADKIASWKSFFSNGSLLSGKISDVAQDARSEMNNAIDQFLDGKLSEDELSEKFQGLLSNLSDACNERGYPTLLGLDKYGQQALADEFHSECRKKLLDAAVTRNNQEGERYAGNGKNGNWQYYNADWYYKSKEGVDALTDGAMQFCHDRGYEDFQLSNGKQPGKLELAWPPLYDDFNGAWMVRNGTMKTFLNPDLAPPEGFEWFCETGGTRAADGITITAHWVDEEEDFSVFRSDDPRSARMWASFRDEDGNLQKLEKIFGFTGGNSGLKNVAALLAFTGKDSGKTLAVNAFLKNMQVARKGYFSFAQTMDVRV